MKKLHTILKIYIISTGLYNGLYRADKYVNTNHGVHPLVGIAGFTLNTIYGIILGPLEVPYRKLSLSNYFL